MRRLLRRLKRALSPSGTLASRTIVSALWTGFTNASGQVLQITLLVVLARVLSPADFGLYGIATLTLTALQRFSRLGFDQALIQRREADIDPYLDTTFTLQILRGALIAGITVVGAPLVADFFAEPRATAILRAVALVMLIQALYNPGTVYFEKELSFHKEFLMSFSGASSRFVVSIGYALVSPTVWALVVGAIAGNLVQLGVSYAVHDYRPWPRFDRDRAAELIGYGKWIFGSSVVSFFYSDGDDIFVGRVLGSASLGLYQVAYRLSNAPATEIAHTISRVSMPAYSKIQDDEAALQAGFHRVLQFSSLASVPTGVGIAVVAPVFVPTFLGDGWGGMVAPMQVLALFGVLRSVRTCASPLFKALGRPDLTAKIHAVRLLLMVVTIYPLTRAFGLVGTAASVLSTSAVGVPIATALVVRLIGDDVRSLAAVVSVPVGGSLLMGGAALAVRRTVSATAGSAVSFAATVLAGVAVYGLFLLAVEWRYEIGLRSFLGQFRQSL
jgi:O-antigen/teichoic acid export membrane protein